jgi:hypothetical protein
MSAKLTQVFVVISPETITVQVVTKHSQATLDSGFQVKQASKIASLI